MTIAAVLVLAGAAVSAFAQTPAEPAAPVAPRPDAQARALVDLAEVLGRQHYLRTLCRGEDDQTWRIRMARMVELEQPSQDEQTRLSAAFNRGFVSLRDSVRECDATARTRSAANARRGAEIAAGL